MKCAKQNKCYTDDVGTAQEDFIAWAMAQLAKEGTCNE